MAATLADVAKKAGVSTASASLVLSGRGDGRVSAAKSEAVRAAAEELNYVRNAVAGSLRTKTSRSIGFVTDHIATTPYAFELVSAATERAREAGYMALLVNTGGDDELEKAAVDEFRSHFIDNIVFAQMSHSEVRIPEGATYNRIIINGFDAKGEIASVVPDEFQGEFDATMHLIDLGHTKIAHITDDGSSVAGRIRVDGYRAALKHAGIEVREDYIISSSFTGQISVDVAAAQILDHSDRPTGITCFNDGVAAGVYRQAHKRGLVIPRDLSVVGFDNFRVIATNLDPVLTTMQLPHKELAEWGVARLLGQETHASTVDPDRPWLHRIECPLVERDSTAPPP